MAIINDFGDKKLVYFFKQLQVQMWNNLKTAWKLMKFI
jgi:hypothetical protein